MFNSWQKSLFSNFVPEKMNLVLASKIIWQQCQALVYTTTENYLSLYFDSTVQNYKEKIFWKINKFLIVQLFGMAAMPIPLWFSDRMQGQSLG